ncbi:hypothetical protein DFH07DRAFT_700551, partial [Mycena maculata]
FTSAIPHPISIPVTFCPAKHHTKSADLKPVTATQILQQACRNQFKQAGSVLQCSIGGRQSGKSDTQFKIIANENGFVNTVMSAYSNHYALIRPDDVWLAIIAQFSFFVNANAELLRANFVAHERKREL